MRRYRQLVAAGMLLICFAAAFLSAVIPSKAAIRPGCPPNSQMDAGALGPESLLRAARAEIPRRYRITNQAGPVKLVPANYRITKVVALTRMFPDPSDARSYRRAASVRCGGSVANNSWAVVVHFPKAQTIPASWGVLFFVPTHSGWRFWMRYH
jgi:hypothetical protein